MCLRSPLFQGQAGETVRDEKRSNALNLQVQLDFFLLGLIASLQMNVN